MLEFFALLALTTIAVVVVIHGVAVVTVEAAVRMMEGKR